MNDLLKIGISEDVIDEMIEKNNIETVAYLNRDHQNVYRIMVDEI